MTVNCIVLSMVSIAPGRDGYADMSFLGVLSDAVEVKLIDMHVLYYYKSK
jgi:hypothetical protein